MIPKLKAYNAMGITLVLISVIAFTSSSIDAQQTESHNTWQGIDELNIQQNGKRHIVPEKYQTFRLDLNALKSKLNVAPLERSAQSQNSVTSIMLPMPNGSQERFQVVEYSMMEPGLAAKFPDIKTYIATSLERPLTTARLDVTPEGFHAMVLAPGDVVFIDPYQKGNVLDYISYYKKDYLPSEDEDFVELAPETDGTEIDLTGQRSSGSRSGDELRIYRMAMAATGEYTQFHGGTVPGALAAIMTTMNRINGVYEQEVSIRMILVANTDLLIYTNPSTDPYTNSSGSTMLGENQINIDNVIGGLNYDMGHVFSTGGGGIASLASPCKTNSKARGVTGLNSPVGDPFDIDYVAHEMGHQFGGTHTWNYCGNAGGGTTDYEPGSATTIMGYAGLCGGNNIQQHSDAYFHVGNIEQIIIYTQNGIGNSCAQVFSTGNNEPSVNSGTGNFTIPISTPFKLEGSATDPDGDSLSYCWEQYDLGPGVPANAPTGNAPLFRSFSPTAESYRIFPQMSDVVDNTQTLGEYLPDYTRQMSFRLTARDHKAGGGGVNFDSYAVNVTDQAGPFLVMHPDTAGIVWESYEEYDVSWDVANTDASPVNCATVNILLSEDGGYTYPYLLATNAPNNGLATIEVPAVDSGTTYRIKVESADNLFFDISNNNFKIVEGEAPVNTSIDPIGNVQDFVFNIFPNPNSGLFTLAGETNAAEPLRGEILDARGRSVQSWVIEKTAGKFTKIIDLSAFSKGIYVIQMTSSDHVVNQKVITY